MAINKSDIQFYLTSLEPNLEQSIRSQSFGGYAAFVKTDPSKSLVYPYTLLDNNLGSYSNEMDVVDYVKINNATKLAVGDAFYKVNSVSSSNVDILNSSKNVFRLAGDVVFDITQNFFNQSFNLERKQYRCIAIRNNSSTETAYNVSVFLKQKSKNFFSSVRISLEVPTSDYYTGSVTLGTNNNLKDSNIPSSFKEGCFDNAMFRVLSGSNINQTRIIKSYSEKEIILFDSLPFVLQNGDVYEIEAGPCQRIKNGLTKPEKTEQNTIFFTPDLNNSINININNRQHGSDLKPNDVIYVWFERELLKDSEDFFDNNVVVSLRYSI